MTKVFERVAKHVNDLWTIPQELNSLAQDYETMGYKVERGCLGVVILKLEDGEVHHIPSGNLIKEIGFTY